jgi:hypothetical protein
MSNETAKQDITKDVRACQERITESIRLFEQQTGLKVSGIQVMRGQQNPALKIIIHIKA